MDLNTVRVVKKPWGRELHFAVEPEYVGKILEVNKGCKLSLQYHKKKKETMYVLSGKMKFTLGSNTTVLSEGESVTIKSGVVHRVEAITDTRIVEVSTNYLEDIVRVEDEYGRK